VDALELVRLYAKAWNNLSYEIIQPYLSDDVRFTSQVILEELSGKLAVEEYLLGKFAAIKRALGTSDVYAEVGYCGKDERGPIALFGYEGRPCILFAQGDISKVMALVLLEVDSGFITSISVCTIAPNPQLATRTGEYPE